MIRGNYSLAKEVKKNELKQKQKIQQRQKLDHKAKSLQDANPILIYYSIQRLENSADLDHHQQKRLAKLREDWAYIRKNKLHQDKLIPFLEKQEKEKQEKLAEKSRLNGKSSIYFNPELNPLGKVPVIKSNTMSKIILPNIIKPIKHPHTYQPDPLISELGIVPPVGAPPMFYKQVQNTTIHKETGTELPSNSKSSSTYKKRRNE